MGQVADPRGIATGHGKLQRVQVLGSLGPEELEQLGQQLRRSEIVSQALERGTVQSGCGERGVAQRLRLASKARASSGFAR
jgi:uncharacterized protein with von Willebrand factor type A (vWA) domain